MKIYQKCIILLFIILGFNMDVSAQLNLPRPSPGASVTQTVGLTDITIDYSSPGVKGRTIWGELVPYDKVWRAGANAATKITFSQDVTIEGVKVPKGSYSIFVIPSKDKDWTIILNKDPKASTMSYNSKENMVKISVNPLNHPFTERLMYFFSDFDDKIATVNLSWEKINVAFKVNVMTSEQAEKNIEKAVVGIANTYVSSANYYLSAKQLDKALIHIDKAIAHNENWYNVWLKAQIVMEQGNKKEALVLAQKAKKLGDKATNFFFKDRVEKAIKDWK